MGEDWKNDPQLANMDPQKLAMLQMLADQGSGKSAQEMVPFLMSAAARGRNSGLQFSEKEIDTILSVLKAGKTAAEVAKLDRVIGLMKMMRF